MVCSAKTLQKLTKDKNDATGCISALKGCVNLPPTTPNVDLVQKVQSLWNELEKLHGQLAAYVGASLEDKIIDILKDRSALHDELTELGGQLDGINGANLEAKVNSLKNRHNVLNERLTKLHGQLDNIDGEDLEAKVNNLKNDRNALRVDLTKLRGQFDGIGGADLEAKVQTLKNDHNAMKAKLTELHGQLKDAEGASLQAKVNALKNDRNMLTLLSGQLDDVEGDTLTVRITALKNQVTSLTDSKRTNEEFAAAIACQLSAGPGSGNVTQKITNLQTRASTLDWAENMVNDIFKSGAGEDKEGGVGDTFHLKLMRVADLARQALAKQSAGGAAASSSGASIRYALWLSAVVCVQKKASLTVCLALECRSQPLASHQRRQTSQKLPAIRRRLPCYLLKRHPRRILAVVTRNKNDKYATH